MGANISPPNKRRPSVRRYHAFSNYDKIAQSMNSSLELSRQSKHREHDARHLKTRIILVVRKPNTQMPSLAKQNFCTRCKAANSGLCFKNQGGRRHVGRRWEGQAINSPRLQLIVCPLEMAKLRAWRVADNVVITIWW